MKFYVKQYPAILLVLFLIYASITGHTTATSIVLLGLCSLSAYRSYLDMQLIPDPSIPLRKELDTIKKQMEIDRSEFTKVKEDFSKVSLSVTRGGLGGQQIRF